MEGSGEDLRRVYESIAAVWKFMREFLTRPDNGDQLWQDLYDASYHGHDQFTARLFAAAIIEIERLKKCGNES